MRAMDVRNIADQLSLGRIAPTTSPVTRHNPVFCAVTPKCTPLVSMFQTAMNKSLDHPGPDGAGFRA